MEDRITNMIVVNLKLRGGKVKDADKVEILNRVKSLLAGIAIEGVDCTMDGEDGEIQFQD